MYEKLLFNKFGFLREFLRDGSEIGQKIVFKKMYDKELILSDEKKCVGAPLVLKGELRLYHISDSGREMKIYNVNEGNICILAAVCIMGKQELDFSTQAEGETILAIIKPVFFHMLLEESKEFRNFVVSEISDKLISSVNLLYDVNFSSIEDRIRKFLQENKNVLGEIKITHENMAVELATSREVISRQLKKLEKEGLIELSRGKIKIISHL